MTEPIAVDAATKPAASVAPLPPLAPLPKLTDKLPEPAKATAPAPTAATTPPAAPKAEPSAPARKAASLTKKITIGASALLSLGAGVAGVRFFLPEEQTPTTVSAVAKAATPPLPVKHTETPKPVPDPERIQPTQVPVTPVSVGPAAPPVNLPATVTTPSTPVVRAAPPEPELPDFTTKPTAPATAKDKTSTQDPLPVPAFGDHTPTTPQKPPAIVQVSGVDPAPRPMAPSAPGGLPPIPGPAGPAIPTVGPSEPALPALPGAGPIVPAAPSGPTLPMLPAGPGPMLPAVPEMGPDFGAKSPPSAPPVPPKTPVVAPADAPKLPAVPTTLPPAPMIDLSPATPTTKPPIPDSDKVVPVTPSKPTPAPVVGLPVGNGPMVPAVPATPTQPDFGPAPAATPVKPISGGSTPPVLEPIPGPAGTGHKPDPKPTVAPAAGLERTPTTSFDVDLHEPKAGDTYESISREFYNDTKYGSALRAYNRNKPLQGSGPVDVPPLHVLKRTTQNVPPGGVIPASQSSPAADPWSSATPTARSTGGERMFRVPQGGMSMRAIARVTLSNEQRWKDIYELNPQLRPDDALPAGTDVRLPADARLP